MELAPAERRVRTRWAERHAALFRSLSDRWSTPTELYHALDEEFHFDFDPCPLSALYRENGLLKCWQGRRVFCNPPYGPDIGKWLAKSIETVCSVYLLPSRTDTAWFHEYALKADEVRFIRGRLKFGDASNTAPFPSLIVVVRSLQAKTRIAGEPVDGQLALWGT